MIGHPEVHSRFEGDTGGSHTRQTDSYSRYEGDVAHSRREGESGGQNDAVNFRTHHQNDVVGAGVSSSPGGTRWEVEGAKGFHSRHPEARYTLTLHPTPYTYTLHPTP